MLRALASITSAQVTNYRERTEGYCNKVNSYKTKIKTVFVPFCLTNLVEDLKWDEAKLRPRPTQDKYLQVKDITLYLPSAGK